MDLTKLVIGQDESIASITPYIQLYRANLAPDGRPVGVFLLLGPTGTGKTHTVESLADVLHGSKNSLVKIDCGEFQLEHEVARLIGAPPGYLGHRETQPMINQQKLKSVVSNNCGLSLVLFDEIEKAAPSLLQLLLGVLDKGILHLGDNSIVNFENSLIFLTSNLGAKEMFTEIKAGFGFSGMVPREIVAGKLHAIAVNAVRRKFSPEFINRIDCTLTYQPLKRQDLECILERQLEALQRHVCVRLGKNKFYLAVSREAREFLLDRGTSLEYGARELNRIIHRHIIQPMAAMVAQEKIPAAGTLYVHYRSGDEKLVLCSETTKTYKAAKT